MNLSIPLKLIITASAALVTIMLSDPNQQGSEAFFAETVEAALLLVSSVVFLFQTRNCPVGYKSVAVFFAMICVAFFLREVEPSEWGVTGTALWLLDDDGRYVFAIPLIGSIILILRNIRTHLNNAPSYLKSPFAKWIYGVMVFLIAGWPLDKQLIEIQNAPLIEEGLELYAYMLLLLASFSLSNSLAGHAKE